VKYTKIM